MPEYPATRKEGIAYFIYKATPLLSINANKKTVCDVFKQYMFVSDSVNRGMGTARRMHASLYDWIVYK